MVETASRYIRDNLETDFFATYFRLPDITQHFITHFMDKEFKTKLKAAYKDGVLNPEISEEATKGFQILCFRYTDLWRR